jgi:hypothetical protein
MSEKRAIKAALKEKRREDRLRKAQNPANKKRRSTKKKDEIIESDDENASRCSSDSGSNPGSDVIYQHTWSPTKSPRVTNNVNSDEVPDSSRKRVRNVTNN